MKREIRITMREVVNLEVEGEDTNTNAAGLFLRGGRGGPNERRALSKDGLDVVYTYQRSERTSTYKRRLKMKGREQSR